MFVFLPVGQLVGWYLENADNGVFAYSVNIVGSLAGIALYTLLCFLSQPQAIWFVLAGFIFARLFWSEPQLRWSSLIALGICAGLIAIGVQKNSRTYWSPYQKLTLTPVSKAGEIISYDLRTNGNWYQHIVNLSPAFVASHPQLFEQTPVQWNAYDFPYRFYPHPGSVLVLGAGTGNDVAAAARNEAKRVTAVEIDPLIIKLGRQLHFEHPYSSRRVRLAGCGKTRSAR